MTGKTQRLIKFLTVLSTLGTLITVGVNLMRAVQEKQQFKKVDRKLDMAVEDTMDCSDAVARY